MIKYINAIEKIINASANSTIENLSIGLRFETNGINLVIT
mgnify:CR=1 FL=1